MCNFGIKFYDKKLTLVLPSGGRQELPIVAKIGVIPVVGRKSCSKN